MDGMAPSMVVDHGENLTYQGRRFWKLSGSGNDFIFFDLADGEAGELASPAQVRRLCARGTGIGADGVVFLRRAARGGAIRYLNSDGSLGELCGNATLCTVRLLERTGPIPDGDLHIDTDSGKITARIVNGLPEIDFAPVTEVVPELDTIPRRASEMELGFARVGVPHVGILLESVEAAPVIERGSEIRRSPVLRDGANVNFLAHSAGQWAIRTYERGVEGETLACGTGAVASAILLSSWGLAESPIVLQTRSGLEVTVSVERDLSSWKPSLRGSAELVFTGVLA